MANFVDFKNDSGSLYDCKNFGRDLALLERDFCFKFNFAYYIYMVLCAMFMLICFFLILMMCLGYVGVNGELEAIPPKPV